MLGCRVQDGVAGGGGRGRECGACYDEVPCGMGACLELYSFQNGIVSEEGFRPFRHLEQ